MMGAQKSLSCDTGIALVMRFTQRGPDKAFVGANAEGEGRIVGRVFRTVRSSWCSIDLEGLYRV